MSAIHDEAHLGAPQTQDQVDLVRRIAHELGNLLAAIRLSAHLLARELPVGRSAADAAEIERTAAQSGALLAQIRTLLADPSGRSVRLAPAEVLSKLQRTLDSPSADAAALEVAPALGLPDVEFDPDALHQLLATLVFSAAGAAGPEGRVRVSAAVVGRRVAFAIEDEARRPAAAAGAQPPVERARPLEIELAAAVLRRGGGRLAARTRPRGTRVELFVPLARRGS